MLGVENCLNPKFVFQQKRFVCLYVVSGLASKRASVSVARSQQIIYALAATHPSLRESYKVSGITRNSLMTDMKCIPI